MNKRPPPIIAGNVVINWVRECPRHAAGYPLPGGEITQDAGRAQAAAEFIAGHSKPVEPMDAYERERRYERIRAQFLPTT